MANPTIKDSILIHHNVGEALRLLKKRMTDLSLTEYMSEVEEIDNDYRIMCGCLAHNMRDSRQNCIQPLASPHIPFVFQCALGVYR